MNENKQDLILETLRHLLIKDDYAKGFRDKQNEELVKRINGVLE